MDDQFSAGNTNQWGDFKVSAIPSASSLTLPNPNSNTTQRRTSLDHVACGATTLTDCFPSQDYVHVRAQPVLEQRSTPSFVMSSPGGFLNPRQATNSRASSWSSSELVPTLPPATCVETIVRPLVSSAPTVGHQKTPGWVPQVADRFSARPPTASPAACSVEQPRAIPVACGSASGIFLVEQASVLLQEDGCLTRKISPTEMERLGGKGAAKKWKTTLRVLDSKGNVGRPVGDWLKKRGIELKTVQRSSQTKAKKKRQTSRVVLKPVNACQTPTKEFKKKEKQQSMVKIAMDAHLERCHVGYRQGDPDCAELPGKLRPAENCPGIREVDLKQMSYEQLLILARSDGSSGGCVSGTLLRSAPGVLAGREAYISGQGPKRRHIARECAEGMALIGEYLNGRSSDTPWEAFGADKPPVVGGQEVDLRELYSKVRMAGGFDQVTMSRQWADISEEMGMSGGLAVSIGYGLRSVYQRFLLRFERQEEALNQFSGGQAPSAAETAPTEVNSKNESTNTATSQSIAKEEDAPPPVDYNPSSVPQSDICQN
ncbi:hypothetical protein BSKO_04767 [Bryopsis sp. KO-2023]|nr:hypothetical protein BSKO_04767 [Bryopsis sp. KO-2023]